MPWMTVLLRLVSLTCVIASDLSRLGLHRAETRLSSLEARLSDLERVAPKEFRIVHYNVLAEQYGSNTNPWFMYGAEPPVSLAERKELTKSFYAKKGDKYSGWPGWAAGMLSLERIAGIEAYDRACFQWNLRSKALWNLVQASHADVLTLAECDQYDGFWLPQLQSAGYAATWRRRPNARARDGCAIAWRESTFELEATHGFDFGTCCTDTEADADRTCCFALLRWRRDPSTKVLIATTHLARSPESELQLWPRSFQFGCIMRELLAFATSHDALGVPVVLSGDLNAKDCDVLSGLARSMTLLLSSPSHPLLWSVLDAPTPATTYTDERSCRIDYLLYQSSLLRLLEVDELPPLARPIPDEAHPSDHLPIGARFHLLEPFESVTLKVREWFACVSGASLARPLSADGLQDAFQFFDKDGSGLVSLLELEVGLQTLGATVGAVIDDISKVRAALRAAVAEESDKETARGGQEGHAEASRGVAVADGHVDQEAPLLVSLSAFVSAYSRAAAHLAASGMARQLDMAFAAFDRDHDGSITPDELRAGLAAASAAPLDEARMAELIRDLDADADGGISREEYSGWLMERYREGLITDTLHVVGAEPATADA